MIPRRAWLLGLLMATAGWAAGGEDFRIWDEAVPGRDEFRVLVRHSRPWPTWLQLEFPTLQNMRADRRIPMRTRIEPNSERRLLVRLERRRPGKFRFRYTYQRLMGDPRARHQDSFLYSFPFEHGTRQKLGQGYNGKISHQGNSRYALDFMLPIGTRVCAARPGIVTKTVADRPTHGNGRLSAGNDPGNHVTVLHEDGTYATYGHLKQGGVLVAPDSRVKLGDVLGLSGNSGNSTGPHLHFQVARGEAETLQVLMRNHDGRAIPAADLTEGRSYYARHPGGPPFQVEAGYALREEELVGRRVPFTGGGKLLVKGRKVDDKVLVYVQNGFAVPKQVEVRLQLQNMVSSTPLPIREVVPARTEQFLALLRPRNALEKWGWKFEFDYRTAK